MNITPFGKTEHLKTEQDMCKYFSAVLESGNTEAILAALGDIAKAKGIAKIAQSSGLNRESLYKALRPGSKPRFETIFRIIQVLNIKLQAVVN